MTVNPGFPGSGCSNLLKIRITDFFRLQKVVPTGIGLFLTGRNYKVTKGVSLKKDAPMFARVKKSGKYQYLQIVENRKVQGKVRQRVIATVGRMDRLQEKDRVETLIRSLSRFSQKAMLILSGRSDVSAEAVTIGPSLIFERLWKETGIQEAIKKMLAPRKFEFAVERAIFLRSRP